MGYDKRLITDILTDVLGSDADGLYLYSDCIYGEASIDDEYFYTNLDTKTTVNYDGIDYHLNWGISKLVIVPDNTSFVIKIPFMGLYDYDAKWQPYLAQEVLTDLCQTEANLYEEANEDLQHILIPIDFVFLYNNRIPVYIQKKIFKTANGLFDTDLEKYVTPLHTSIVNNLIHKLYPERRNKEMLLEYTAHLLPEIGIARTKELIKAISEIDDLHSGNWGIDENGELQIFDYAGFETDRVWGY